MADDIFIINPAVGIRNGEVVVLPQPGQVGKAGATNQGSGGFVLSYPVSEPDRVQTVTDPNTAQGQAGYRFRGELTDQPVPMSTQDTTSAVGADAIIDYPAAGQGYSHVIDGLAWSYSATPTNGSVRIEDGSGNIVFGPLPVTQAGPGFYQFSRAKRGTPNTDLRVILANGGASVSGVISVLEHWLI